MATKMGESGDTYWPSVCGNGTVNNAIWSWDYTIYTYTPDLTLCFQQTILTWTTCGLLWLLTLLYVPFIRHNKTVHRVGSISRHNLILMVVISLLATNSLVELAYYIQQHNDGSLSNEPLLTEYLCVTVQLATYILAAVLTHWLFRKGKHSPGILFIFWIVQLLSGIITFRSQVLRWKNRDESSQLLTFITANVQFGLVIIVTLMSLFADPEARVSSTRGQHQGSEDEAPLLGDSDAVNTEGHKPCPEMQASFMSILYFGWFFKKVVNGYRRTLVYDDIWDIRPQDSSAKIVPEFENAWERQFDEQPKKNDPSDTEASKSQPKSKYGGLDETKFTDGSKKETKEKKKKGPSLFSALFRTFGVYFCLIGIILLGMDVTTLLNPIILEKLISFIQTNGEYTWHGYLLGVTMFVVSNLNMLFFVHHFTGGYTVGMRSRTALISAIYRKALRLSNSARKTTTTGEIVNLMSVDTEKIVIAFLGTHFLWSAPLVLCVAMYFQYQIIGPSCLMGLVVMFGLIPVNSMLLAAKIRTLQKAQMTLKDGRIKLMNQVLNGIKVLKLYAWEPEFRDEILKIRNQELALLKTASMLSSITYSMWFMSSFLVAFLDFLTYTLMSEDGVLDPQKAFTVLSLIQAQSFQFNMLPQMIMWLVQAQVSMKRLQDFFLQDELDPDNVIEDSSEASVVKIEDGTFSWGEAERLTLKNINLDVPRGSLVGIVGQVGAGKSSIVSAILGEMERHSGRVITNGRVAYVPQQAWIQNLTLRDNVLFSRPHNQDRYSEILKACALEPDLETLPGGDLTEIGERGINLSGGQKQRVSLARAVYQDTDIYLLDDPLSAVDAHVGTHIFQHVVGPEGLLKHKTRILVTHGITYLSKMDLIVVMKDGQISEMGSYEELLQHHGDFSEFIHTYLTEYKDEIEEGIHENLEEIEKLQKLTANIEKATSSEKASRKTSDAGSTSSKNRSVRRRRRMQSEITSHSGKSGRSKKTAASLKKELEKEIEMKNKLIEEEKSAEGGIGMGVMKAYAAAASVRLTVLAFVCFFFYVAAQVGTSIWLSEWTNDALLNATTDHIPSSTMRLGVYGAFGFIQVIAITVMSLTIVIGSVSASNVLHSSMLHKIVRCPMSFFDTTPLGRIINRFSKDVDIMDTNIQQYVLNVFLVGGPLLTTFIVIIYTSPLLIVMFVPLAIIFALLQRFYVYCSRQIKRIDAVKKSPIYAFFSETLNGTSVVRAYRAQDRFIKHSDLLLDNSQKVYLEVFSSNRWVNVWAEVVGELVILFAAIFVVLQRDSLNPSLAALSLTFSLQVSLNLVFTVRNTCDLETYIVSVERIKEYADLEPEAAWIIPEKRPPDNWPQSGAVNFHKYSTRYREGMDLVLKDVTCQVKPGEKIGIVGRTGAGKSSMTLGLFRIIEAAGGHIDIDGLDISQMGLHDVRSKLTIIPQDPVLFSGSLRFNLDPSRKYTDLEIWTSLEQAHLKSFVQTLPDTIEYECGENGENLSVGQRQLVCLARALLRQTKLLVLDEATAAVDMETDDLIQSTISSEFKHCTVMTIAHRLNTIMDYDRVIVMADGEIKEIDSPNILKENTKSLFHAMAKDAGVV